MRSIEIIQSKWARKVPPFGAFDEFVIITSPETNQQFRMRPEEFDALMSLIFDKWKLGKCKYFQILKEWNEEIGFKGIEGRKSRIQDVKSTINGIKLIQGLGTRDGDFGSIINEEIELILRFLKNNQNAEIEIFLE